MVTGGSAVAVPRPPGHSGALLYAWYPGAEGGRGVADVLFGDVSPAGRLPITLYRAAADLPPFNDYAMRGRTYRYLEKEPLYPFGYGLSYTSFHYKNLVIVAPEMDREGSVSVTVSNEGARAGDEVVQLYVVPRQVPAYAPRRWLAGFARVGLRPGEERRVVLPLAGRALTLVDERGARGPLGGAIEIAVGGGQPDRAGRFADEFHGLSATLSLP